MTKIPVLNLPSQRFTIQINEEEKEFEFFINYISRGEYFAFSLKINGVQEIEGLKIVSGIPLLSAFNLTQGDFFSINSAEYTQDPVMGSWGNATELFYLTKEEVEL